MELELFNHELNVLGQALRYAVMYSLTEAETAEFAMLKVKVDVAIVAEQERIMREVEHKKMNCVFKYCSQNPKCEGTCYLNKTQQH